MTVRGIFNSERETLMSLYKALWDFMQKCLQRLAKKKKGWERVQISFLEEHVWHKQGQNYVSAIRQCWWENKWEKIILIYEEYLSDYFKFSFIAVFTNPYFIIFLLPIWVPWPLKYRTQFSYTQIRLMQLFK